MIRVSSTPLIGDRSSRALRSHRHSPAWADLADRQKNGRNVWREVNKCDWSGNALPRSHTAVFLCFAEILDCGRDGLIVRGELFLDAGFELIEAFGEFLVRAQELAQLYEGANDVDAHLDSPWAIEDSGSHDGAVLGERIGKELDVLAAPWLQDHRL